MMTSKKVGFIFTFLIGLIVLSIVYPKVLFSPNQYLFNKTDDGNYFIYAWHIKHDTSFLHFDGISYPYGESISMDSLHSYSFFVKSVSKVFPAAENYAIGFLNLLMLISIVVGAAFLYLILIHFQLPWLVSAFVANAIAFSSSQVWLFSPAGHYGLMFVCFFPMAWYFLIKYYEKPGIQASIVIGLNTLFWTFSHVYLGFIITLFVGLTHLTNLILKKKLPQKIGPFLWSVFIQLAVPFLVFLLLHVFGGDHPNRIDMPFVDGYSNTFSSIFFPVSSPFQPFFFWVKSFAFATNDWSSIGVYIGLITHIILLILLFKIVQAIFNRNVKGLKPYFSQNFNVFLISALILLLYSVAIPIKYLPDNLINSLPLIKQFSSLGRVGWVFYFVITVFCFVFIYNLTCKHKVWRNLTYIFAVLLFIEGLHMHTMQSSRISQFKNTFLADNLSENQRIVTQINGPQFQAILPLPYYFKFSVPITASGTDSSIFYSQLASYYTGLPIMSTYLSRPSVVESMNIYRQLLPFPFQVPIDKVIEDGRDILVITYKADSNKYNANEKLLLQKSAMITSNNEVSLYRLSVDNLFEQNNDSRVNSFKQNADKLYAENNIWVSDTALFYIYNDYEQIDADIAYNGNGAFKGIKNQYSILCDTQTSIFDTSLTYRLSLWYYNHLWDQTFATVVINEKDSSGNDLTYDYFSPIEGKIIDGWWYLSERVFKIKSNKGRLKIFIHGSNLFRNEIYVDQFMLKPECLDTYQIEKLDTSSVVIKNNLKFCYIKQEEVFVGK